MVASDLIAETYIFFGVMTIIFIGFIVALWVDYRNRRDAAAAFAAATLSTGGGGSVPPSNTVAAPRDFPYYCRRIGIWVSLCCVIWAIDMHGSLGIIPVVVSDLLCSTSVGLYFGVASLWVWFHVAVIHKHLNHNQPLPAWFGRLLATLPPLIWFGMILSNILGAFDNSLFYQLLYTLILAISALVYSIVGFSTAVMLQQQLKQFIATLNLSAQRSAAATAAGANGAPARLVVSVSPTVPVPPSDSASTIGAPVSPPAGPVAPSKYAKASNWSSPRAAPPAASNNRPPELAHLHTAMRVLWTFSLILAVCGMMLVILTVQYLIDGFESGAFEPRPPPPTELSDVWNELLLNSVGWLLIATMLWYGFPQVRNKNTVTSIHAPANQPNDSSVKPSTLNIPPPQQRSGRSARGSVELETPTAAAAAAGVGKPAAQLTANPRRTTGASAIQLAVTSTVMVNTVPETSTGGGGSGGGASTVAGITPASPSTGGMPRNARLRPHVKRSGFNAVTGEVLTHENPRERKHESRRHFNPSKDADVLVAQYATERAEAATDALAIRQWRLWYERMKLEAGARDAVAEGASKAEVKAERAHNKAVIKRATHEFEKSIAASEQLSAQLTKTDLKLQTEADSESDASDDDSDVPRRVARRRARDERRLLESIRRRADGEPIDQCVTDAAQATIKHDWNVNRNPSLVGALMSSYTSSRLGSGSARAGASMRLNQLMQTAPQQQPPKPRVMASPFDNSASIGSSSGDRKSAVMTAGATIVKPGTVLLRAAMASLTDSQSQTVIAPGADADVTHRAIAALTQGPASSDSKASHVHDIARGDATAVPALELQARAEAQLRSHAPERRHTHALSALSGAMHNDHRFRGGHQATYAMDDPALPRIRWNLRRGHRHAQRRVYRAGEVTQRSHVSTDWMRESESKRNRMHRNRNRSTPVPRNLTIAQAETAAAMRAPAPAITLSGVQREFESGGAHRSRRSRLEAHLHRVGVLAARMANQTSNKRHQTASGYDAKARGATGKGGHARERRVPKPNRAVLADREASTAVATELVQERVTTAVMDVGSARVVPSKPVLAHNKRERTILRQTNRRRKETERDLEKVEFIRPGDGSNSETDIFDRDD